MHNSTMPFNRRILIVDDNRDIHHDFRKVLGGGLDDASSMAAAELAILGETAPSSVKNTFEIDSAYQGQEGWEKVRASVESGARYAMAFVDMRMPPGWDGVETIAKIWEVDPEIRSSSARRTPTTRGKRSFGSWETWTGC